MPLLRQLSLDYKFFFKSIIVAMAATTFLFKDIVSAHGTNCFGRSCKRLDRDGDLFKTLTLPR